MAKKVIQTAAESTEKYSEYIHTHTCTHAHTHTRMNAEMPPLPSYTTGDYMNVRKDFKIYL